MQRISQGMKVFFRTFHRFWVRTKELRRHVSSRWKIMYFQERAGRSSLYSWTFVGL